MIAPGKIIEGYRVESVVVEGGKSQSGTATKVGGGGEYFLKQFISPKFPVGDTDPVHHRQQMAACEQFERRHRSIMASLDQFTNGSGHLVKPLDFFRAELTYYKVYPYVVSEDRSRLSGEAVRSKEVFLKTLALSLRELHIRDIVHCDIKADNVLIHRTKAGPTAKLIDFDEAFVVGDPPRTDRLGGDEKWFSPERQLVEDEEADSDTIGLASDVFSFVLLVQQMLCGTMPTVVGTTAGGSVAERINAGGAARLDPFPFATADFNALAPMALDARPERRPTIVELCASLGLPAAQTSRVMWNAGTR